MGELFSAVFEFVGIIGVIILVVGLIMGIVIWVVMSFVAVWVPLHIFTHTAVGDKLRPGRVVIASLVLIPMTVGLFLIRWYIPFAICGAAGLVVVVMEWSAL